MHKSETRISKFETNPKFKYQMLKTLFSLFVFQISIFVFSPNILANSPVFGIITVVVVAVAATGKTSLGGAIPKLRLRLPPSAGMTIR